MFSKGGKSNGTQRCLGWVQKVEMTMYWENVPRNTMCLYTLKVPGLLGLHTAMVRASQHQVCPSVLLDNGTTPLKSVQFKEAKQHNFN